MIKLLLHRRNFTDLQVTGFMEVYQDGVFQFVLSTLEQEWNNNETNNSCIPEGDYKVEHYSSKKYPEAFRLKGTEPRTYILIHKGSYHEHTSGCILVGLTHSDINSDGYMDTKFSKEAMEKLLELCKDETNMSIEIKS